jgi:hypothetical protein
MPGVTFHRARGGVVAGDGEHVGFLAEQDGQRGVELLDVFLLCLEVTVLAGFVGVFEMDEEDSPEPKDAPMSKMTMKDHCAIEWRLPVSDKQWLNDLIRKTNIESAKKSK